DGGILMSAWTGVAPTFSQALGQHRSASGLGSALVSPTIADPGAITVNPGALAWGMTLGSPPAGVDGPTGWTQIEQASDQLMKNDGEYDAEFTVSSAGGTADPQWSWFFPATGTWLASVLALNAASTTGNLTVTTTTSGDNVPTTGYTVSVDGSAGQSIAVSGSVTFTDLSPGTHTVTLSGVPTNCQVAETNPASVTIVAGETATVTFTITCTAPPPPPPPPPPPGDFVTGGGKLGSGREFATFGLHASSSDGNFEWVQHCPNGSSTSPACAQGGFKFHGTVTPGTYAQTARGPNCRTWSGTGSSKETGAQSFTVRQACDGGEPGRGNDYIEVSIDGYQNSGYLTGGNIQLHRSKS
ncbi:MAG TPA: post-COAP-1 domain-containing protein, partial [Gemmatimonadales bacterium]|nr:post-COAP-1 domain-containing protein [Gemmatimonadales bacterium]